MATGLSMVTQQLDASSEGVSYVTIYVVQRENRKWPTSQNRMLSPHHHFHTERWTVSVHGTLGKAGENWKGTEPLFTCLAIRAIHIEVVHTMETDSFFQALRCVIAWTGPIRELCSDQGTNFLGAQKELKRSFQEMGDERIKGELLKHNIDWIRNCAMASNLGSAWERQIRSVRNIMAALMKQHGHSLDDESLQTLLCEVEDVVNSRPLPTKSLSDPLSPLPLTPSALLILLSSGKFQREDFYC